MKEVRLLVQCEEDRRQLVLALAFAGYTIRYEIETETGITQNTYLNWVFVTVPAGDIKEVNP